MTVKIIAGDCRTVLKTLPDESVHCVVTSPPYFGLRDYGMADQIGLEQTPQAFVDELVAVFREVRRVLRSDGTLWLNLGDSYATGAGGVGDCPGGGKQGESWKQRGKMTPPNRLPLPGLKPKALIGIPWRVAFALQADGWWLRQDIIWHKPNPMPESVRDRCTKAHEYLFLLAKSERYYFDADAMQEPSFAKNAHDATGGFIAGQVPGQPPQSGTRKSGNKERKPASARGVPVDTGGKSAGAVAGSVPWEGATRNKRSVWTIATQPYSEAHFATFPPALIEPCIKAGCPEGGTVLDPFAGAGTTGLVADRLQRNALLIELNPAYIEIAERRIRGDAPLFAEVAA